MRTVGIRVLKDKLSEYVRLVESGETVLVTNRDRVVAELRPPDRGRSVSASDALLADAVRRGVLSAPTGPGHGAPPRQPAMSLQSVLEGLTGDRDER